jgi:hypothetical protein
MKIKNKKFDKSIFLMILNNNQFSKNLFKKMKIKNKKFDKSIFLMKK